MPGHGFTHCDGFSHFIRGGTTVDRMPIETWVGDAAVVDLTHVGANTAVEAADLESRGRARAPGRHRAPPDRLAAPAVVGDARVLDARRPWTSARRLPLAGRAGGQGRGIRLPAGPPHPRARHRPPPRPIAPEEWATHHTFFPVGIGVIEYLVNLDRLGRDRVRFAALPLRLDGGDGAPARAIAILD